MDLIEATDVFVDMEDNVYVTGWKYSATSGDDYVTIKYDPDGVTVWIKTYDGPGSSDDRANAIMVDIYTGDVYVTGESKGSGTGYDYATIKYSSGGTQLWVSRYNGTGNGDDKANSLFIDVAGSIYVTGEALGTSSGADIVTIKYDKEGVSQWNAVYNGAFGGNDVGTELMADTTLTVDTVDAASSIIPGPIYVIGHSEGSINNKNYITLKYSTAGTLDWSASYDHASKGTDIAHDLIIDASHNAYVTGQSESSSTNIDYLTIKYSFNGVQMWTARYDGLLNETDKANAIFVNGQGDVYVTGESELGSNGFDFLTVRYNNSGVQQWTDRYNGPGNGDDRGLDVMVDQYGDVLVSGYSLGFGTNNDFATIKYGCDNVKDWTIRYNGVSNTDDRMAAMMYNYSNGHIYITALFTLINVEKDLTMLQQQFKRS